MNRKDFRRKLVAILKDAGVSQSLSRERFVNLSWKKVNGEKCLFLSDIEKNACSFVIKKLKEAHKYHEYRYFMGNWFTL